MQSAIQARIPDRNATRDGLTMKRAASVFVPVLALAMLALTFAPSSFWSHPTYDVVYTGFDPNFMYSAASVHMTSSSLDMQAAPGSEPTADLFTTLLQHVDASVDASVIENTSASEPFRIGIWTPWSDSGEFVVFGPPPQDDIAIETLTDGIPGATLIGGQVASYSVFGHYQAGRVYHLSFDVDKVRRVITASVSGDDAIQGQGTMTPEQSSKIFAPVQVSLTASSYPGAGMSRVVLSKYRFRIYHQRLWASKTDDSRAIWLLGLLGGMGLLAIILAIAFWAFVLRARLPVRMATIHLSPGLGAAFAFYLAGNALLFPLGMHPFDMGDQQLFAYVARVFGPDQLFFLPNAVSLASVWGGVPYGEFAFPYEAATAYLSTATGWLASLLFAGGGAVSLTDPRLVYIIKSINVVFGLADSVLIYSVLQRIGMNRRWSLVPAALFLFNPAVWFSMSVWGQTHVISLCFVLAAIYCLERRAPLWAWLFLTVACLTRPQMLVFGLLLGIVFLRRFTWQENLHAISWTVIATFVALLPLTLRTDPSLPLDIVFNNFGVQEAGGNNPALTTVSQGAYSIWPLVTYFAHGASGTLRAFTPSAGTLIGPLSYQRAGQLLTLAALTLVSLALWFRRTTIAQPGGYIPLVTLGVISFLMFLTGIVSTHFLLALPLLLMCRRWMSTGTYFFAVAAWSLTTLVPMFGDMGIALTNHPEQLLAPGHNLITKFAISVYSWDRAITVGIVANLLALGLVAARAFRQRSNTLASV